jgi:hypothetical protein
MADKRKAPEAPKGAHRRKRAAPTIDLTATEVQAPAAGEAPAHTAAEPPVSGPLPHQTPHEPSSEPAPEPPPPPGEQPSAPGAAASDQVAATHGGGTWFDAKALAAGFAGAAIVAIVLLALWFSGVLPAPYAASNYMSERVAALQKQVQDLQNRPAPAPAVDPKTVDALSQRVAKIESSVAKLPPSDAKVAERLTAAENAMKSLGLALTALNKRSGDIAANAANARAQAEAAEKAVTQLRGNLQDIAKGASTAVAPAEFNALQQRIAALEQSSKAAREDIAKTAAAEKAVRLALSATALRSVVTSGAPFAAELAQAKSLGADDKVLAPLQPFAATGVPSAAALAQELRALLPAMMKASGAQAPSGSFLERLEANAGKLVRIKPVNAPPGNDASAVLARIEIAAAHADIAGALADLGKLPEPARALAQAWIARTQARQAALAAARSLASDAAHALGQQ